MSSGTVAEDHTPRLRLAIFIIDKTKDDYLKKNIYNIHNLVEMEINIRTNLNIIYLTIIYIENEYIV